MSTTTANVHAREILDSRGNPTVLGQATDRQLRGGLEAAGATAEERSCLVQALRDRIERLRRATAR